MYANNCEENYIEWMGFSFYVSQDNDAGMQLHDIRFKNERIIFELGMQEAMAHYVSLSGSTIPKRGYVTRAQS